MNPQVFGAEPLDIGIGLIVDGQRHSDHSAPGIEVYDDRGELEMLGRTAWLEVAFGSGWAVREALRLRSFLRALLRQCFARIWHRFGTAWLKKSKFSVKKNPRQK